MKTRRSEQAPPTANWKCLQPEWAHKEYMNWWSICITVQVHFQSEQQAKCFLTLISTQRGCDGTDISQSKSDKIYNKKCACRNSDTMANICQLLWNGGQQQFRNCCIRTEKLDWKSDLDPVRNGQKLLNRILNSFKLTDGHKLYIIVEWRRLHCYTSNSEAH